MSFAGCPETMREAALWHAARGRPVFPCYFKAQPDGKISKRPLTQHGFLDATTDAAQITKWWTDWPEAGIGMPCGPASGLMALDYDVDHGEDVEEVRDDFHARFDLPQTLMVASIRGGIHEYLQYAPGIAREIKLIHPAVDILGEGGYVVLPPSRMSDGRAYRVVFDAEPCEATELLLSAIKTAKGQPNLRALSGGLESPEYRDDLAMWADLDEPGKWHTAQRTLVARYVHRGIPASAVTAMAPAFRRAPYSLEQTIKEIGSSARGAAKKYGKAPSDIEIGGFDTPATPASPIKIWSLDDIQSRDPPAWLIGGMVPENAFGCLYGESNTFKSFIALDMALAIAYGRPWHGRPVRQGAVLYVLGEGQTAFANRVRCWREAYGLQDAPAPFYAILEPVQFGVPADIVKLIAAVRDQGLKPDMSFLDTLARNFGPGDPDRTQDMQVFVEGTGAYQREVGGALMIIHHAGKDPTKGARNSSVLKAAVDVEMRAEREERSDRVKLVTTKQKDAEQSESLWLQSSRVEAVDPRTGEAVTSLVFVFDGPADKPGEIKGALERRLMGLMLESGITIAGASITLSEDKSNVRRALKRLTEKDLALKQEIGGEVTFFVNENNVASAVNDLNDLDE